MLGIIQVCTKIAVVMMVLVAAFGPHPLAEWEALGGGDVTFNGLLPFAFPTFLQPCDVVRDPAILKGSPL
jgi:hypothetical protein